jgi:hypothetical protein
MGEATVMEDGEEAADPPGNWNGERTAIVGFF